LHGGENKAESLSVGCQASETELHFYELHLESVSQMIAALLLSSFCFEIRILSAPTHTTLASFEKFHNSVSSNSF
jgi:hypothetical protein